MSALDHILGQLDRPDHEHAYSREDVTNARAELQRLRAALKSAADMLQAVAGDIEDGGSLDTLRSKYCLAVLDASDRARAALKATP